MITRKVIIIYGGALFILAKPNQTTKIRITHRGGSEVLNRRKPVNNQKTDKKDV